MNEFNAPWTFKYRNDEYHGDGEITDFDGNMVAITTGPNYGAYHASGYEHFEKYARLIAAAPELLEALQVLFGADMETCMLMDGKEDQLQALSKAHLALAKATGESA